MASVFNIKNAINKMCSINFNYYKMPLVTDNFYKMWFTISNMFFFTKDYFLEQLL